MSRERLSEIQAENLPRPRVHFVHHHVFWAEKINNRIVGRRGNESLT